MQKYYFALQKPESVGIINPLKIDLVLTCCALTWGLAEDSAF